jgi:hypothetical protein
MPSLWNLIWIDHFAHWSCDWMNGPCENYRATHWSCDWMNGPCESYCATLWSCDWMNDLFCVKHVERSVNYDWRNGPCAMHSAPDRWNGYASAPWFRKSIPKQ